MSTLASEKFFYIMDYSSHYYRVDSKDQLVAAVSENEATIFSFADANRRIGAGPKSRFYYMTPVNTEDEEASDEEQATSDEDRETVRGIPETAISKAVAENSDVYDLAQIDWEEYLTNFAYIAGNINCYKDELTQKLSEVDKKICDILHYIELCDTDEDDARHLVELLRICRENRREYKDELFRADMFQKNIGTSANIAKVKDALKSIKGLSNRKYTPRKLSELFDGKVISAKTHEKKYSVVPTDQSEPETDNNEYQEEVSQMEYIKRETPFDGKENDWLAFARRQAEFYGNADQYIVNLEMELDEIDSMITSLMDEIEVANCNVTQGYKMFKQLKELRQARTKKEVELKVLYDLTGNFDMGAMAEECRRSVGAVEEILKGPSVAVDDGEKLIDIAG